MDNKLWWDEDNVSLCELFLALPWNRCSDSLALLLKRKARVRNAIYWCPTTSRGRVGITHPMSVWLTFTIPLASFLAATVLLTDSKETKRECEEEREAEIMRPGFNRHSSRHLGKVLRPPEAQEKFKEKGSCGFCFTSTALCFLYASTKLLFLNIQIIFLQLSLSCVICFERQRGPRCYQRVLKGFTTFVMQKCLIISGFVQCKRAHV